MANSDKNLVITPNVGSSGDDPKITFSGADASLGAQSLQARIYPTSNGTLSFEGSAGQLFSITNSLTGTIYSVNDVSGLPSIEVFDDGVVRLARYAGRVIIGNIADNGVDTLQFAQGASINFSSVNANGNINATGNISATQYTSTIATGTAPFTVASTTVVANLNADKVDGKDIGTLTAAGGIAYATSTTALAATAAGTSGQAVISGGAGAPTFQTVASANGASTIVARTADGSFTVNGITATTLNIGSQADTATAASHYYVETASDGIIRPKTLANVRTEIVTAASVYSVGVLSGVATQSFVQYNSTTATAGAFDGGATAPSGTTRLNYGGYLYATRYYTSNIYDITGATGTPTIYPDVTTGSITIGAGLTTGTLNLGSSAAGAKTVNIGTSTGTTVVGGSTVRLPNAGTPGAGKYLQSDASGNATWQTVVAGATITNDTTTNSDAFYPGMASVTSGAWTAATVSSTKLYYNPSTGQLNATNFNSLSDATKKENVKTIENATEKTLALRGVTFDWIDTQKAALGVIAQEVEQIVPDAVSTSSSGEKSVNYGSLVGLLIQTLKEQNARIEALEAIIAAK